MGKIKSFLFLPCVLLASICIAQSVEIEGQVFGSFDIEGVHVINKTSSRYTTTTASGSFNINAKLNDTIVFSSLQYKLTAAIVTSQNITQKKMAITLEEQVTFLDEVTVGKVLSGDLEFDIKNADLDKPIDFYDVGIPGYTGKPKTQSERRLHEADAGKYVAIGFGVGLNLHKILNAVTGRTKELKERVRKEHNDELLNKIQSNLSDNFFLTYPLDEALRTDFFYFCSEDENFENRCNNRSDIEIFEFLGEKIVAYKSNLASKND